MIRTISQTPGGSWVIPLIVLATTGCVKLESPSTPTATGSAPAGSPEAAGPSTIHVDLGVYNAGHRPAGIGENLVMADVIARAWEAEHPNRSIKYQVLSLLNVDSGEGEALKAQLLGGIAPEIIHLNAEVAWPDVGKGWFVALDDYLSRPNRYVAGNRRWMDIFLNQAMVNAKRAPDGKLYCLPIDIIETGIYYNKDLLAEHGVTHMPETWVEMEAMFDKLRAADIIPLAVSGPLGADWGQDIIFEMVYHDIMPKLDLVPSRPGAADYLRHYLEPPEIGFLFSKGFFTRRDPRWRETYRLLERWRRYWPRELKNGDFRRLFVNRRVAMMWESSVSCRRMIHDPLIDFEWGVFYVPALTSASSRWGVGTPATVIGGAAVQLHVTHSAVSNGNLDDCIDFLMYLTAPRNAERLINEAGVFIPNLVDTEMAPQLAPFREIFGRPYCAVKWLESMEGKHKKYYRRMVDYYLQGGVDLDGFLARLEDNFAAWAAGHRDEASWDFDRFEPIWRQREAELIRELDAGG